MRKLISLILCIMLTTSTGYAALDTTAAAEAWRYSGFPTTADQPYTISAWVNFDTSGTGDFFISISESLFVLGFRRLSSGRIGLRVDYNPTDNEERISNTSTVSNGTWYHVLVTYDGSKTAANQSIYLDGSEVSYSTTTDGVGTQETIEGSWQVGGNSGNSNFDGIFHDIGFWDRVLDASEIAMLADGFSPVCIPRGLISAPKLTREKIDPMGMTLTVIDSGATAVDGARQIIYCE